MQTYVKQQYIVLNDLRDGEKGSIFVALIFNYIIQTFRLISFGNYFCIFQRLVCENRSFISDYHNFGLVSGKVIYDIVSDALMIDLFSLGNGGKFLMLNTLNFRIWCCKFGIRFVSLWCKDSQMHLR